MTIAIKKEQQLTSSQGFALQAWQSQATADAHNARIERAIQGTADEKVKAYLQESKYKGEGWHAILVKTDRRVLEEFIGNRETPENYRIVPALITSYPSGQLHSYIVQEQAVS